MIFSKKRLKTSKLDQEGQKDLKMLALFYQKEEDHQPFFNLSLEVLEFLNNEAATKTEYQSYLLEDVINTSLYLTFYEHLFLFLRKDLLDSNGNTRQIIAEFIKARDVREQTIATQSQEHVEYILNQGYCKGCTSCSHHKDVHELIWFWNQEDTDFFENLFVGMQTIQFSMEYFLEEIIPHDRELLEEMTSQNVLLYRQEIFKYTENLL